MSVALSEMTNAGQLGLTGAFGGHPGAPKSPEHLVNRKVLLERMGMTVDGTSDTAGSHSARPGSSAAVRASVGARNGSSDHIQYPQWTMNSNNCGNAMNSSSSMQRSRTGHSSSYSMDRLSMSSHGSNNSNYDSPKNLNNNSNGNSMASGSQQLQQQCGANCSATNSEFQARISCHLHILCRFLFALSNAMYPLKR